MDPQIIEDIVAACAPAMEDALVEIGPGMGALTHTLLQSVRHLTLIEIDRDLAQHWQQRENTSTRLHVIQEDVLRVNFGDLHTNLQKPLRLIGNLPYNISSPVLFHLLPWAHCIVDQHFMLQKEVVDRMVAQPSTASYGRLSVMLQWRYDMQALLSVPPAAFEPAPKVHSAVVRMKPKSRVANVSFATLEELVRVAFSHRRKLLRHSLGPWLEARATECRFDLLRRAEEVSPCEYVDLAASLHKER